MRILVVDDSIDEQALISNALLNVIEPRPDIYFAYCCDEARGIIEESHNSIDCVLLDQKMPKITGIKCLDIIRNQNKYKGPVILLTNQLEADVVVNALNNGADDFVLKNELEAKIKKAINRAITKSLELKRIEKRAVVKHKELEKVSESLTNVITSIKKALEE